MILSGGGRGSCKFRIGFRECSFSGGGPAYFLASFKGGATQFFARSVGGPPIFLQKNLKIECTIDQINCNINRQIISSTSYLKNFSRTSNHVSSLSCLQSLQKTSFSLFQPAIYYDHFSEWMNEA